MTRSELEETLEDMRHGYAWDEFDNREFKAQIARVMKHDDALRQLLAESRKAIVELLWEGWGLSPESAPLCDRAELLKRIQEVLK